MERIFLFAPYCLISSHVHNSPPCLILWVGAHFNYIALCSFSNEPVINLVSFTWNPTCYRCGSMSRHTRRTNLGTYPSSMQSTTSTRTPKKSLLTILEVKESVDCCTETNKCNPCRGLAHCECDICKMVATASWTYAPLPISTTVFKCSQIYTKKLAWSILERFGTSFELLWIFKVHWEWVKRWIGNWKGHGPYHMNGKMKRKCRFTHSHPLSWKHSKSLWGHKLREGVHNGREHL